MKFVDDWKQAYKWLSIHAAGAMLFFNALQASFVQVQHFISAETTALVNAGLAIGVIWLRLLKQGD